MKKYIFKLLFLLIFLTFSEYCRSEEFTMEKLAEFETELTKIYQEYLEAGIAREVDLYPIVLARIEMAIELYSDNYYSKEAEEEFEMLQILTEAAKIQMIAAKNYAVNLEVQKEGEEILREINEMREEISKIKQRLANERAIRIQKELEEKKAEAERKFYKLRNELINVKRDARGTIISMSDILFDIGKATLSYELTISLAKIAGILLVYRDSRIIIEGHTDNTGSAEFNQILSEDRAYNVKEFLIELGVDEYRLSSTGYGFRRPDASNSTEEGRKINRRVDIIISDL